MSFDFSDERLILKYLSETLPTATAYISGSYEYPGIQGIMNFYQVPIGVYVVYSFTGLPNGENNCGSNILGLHIHDGKMCSRDDKDPFADAGAHYNPEECPHPWHAGDLPPLFVNDGYAFGAVFTHRFNLEDLWGRTVIVHSQRDDFTSQPSGDAGQKIACGIIRRM